MKHFKLAVMALLVVAGLSNVNAQDENNPWAISVGVNAVDYYPTNDPTMVSDTGINTGWYSQFFNADDHYNMVPSVSRLSVGRYIASGFSLEVAGTYNKIDQVGETTLNNELTYIGADLAIMYDLNNIFLKNAKTFDPYAFVGGGYTWMEEEGSATFNGGLGANIWLGKNLGLYIQSAYKHVFDEDYPNVQQPHFQHSAGVKFRFGGKDTDGDGIYDRDDACPEVAGLEMYKGCPDTDEDGIVDGDDACPEVKGLAELNGCPDMDEDGIADANDNCPEVKGTKANGGCPDTDGDGVLDKEDKCVNEAGPAANNGCPWLDTDGDGVLDKDDKCPEVVGVASQQGCPEPPKVVAPTEKDKEALRELARTVYFNSSKSTFKGETEGRLNQIADIMVKYPDARFHIEGHTDSSGSNSLNQRLSETRANAVRSYLVSRGVGSSKLTAQGYGEDRPIADNKTRAGRATNRRVEIKLVR